MNPWNFLSVFRSSLYIRTASRWREQNSAYACFIDEDISPPNYTQHITYSVINHLEATQLCHSSRYVTFLRRRWGAGRFGAVQCWKVTIPQRHIRTDGQTDGRTTCLGNTALRGKSCCFSITKLTLNNSLVKRKSEAAARHNHQHQASESAA